MSLREYRRKRNFSRTSEPEGGAHRSGLAYCIQKHDASRLHYDFRLQHGDVMWSWAVPKGPSLDPTDKRLAVQVEDHPLDYRTFEGTIPEGEYGGGTVMIWDEGEWEPQGDAASEHRAGKLKFTLYGEKLRGGWALVRMRSRGESKPQWLLIKERDAEARSAKDGDVLEQHPDSAKTGRTLEEIAEGASPRRARKRTSGRRAKHQSSAERSQHNGRAKRASPAGRISNGALPKDAPIEGAVKGKMPAVPTAQLATLVSQPPEGANWLHEMKFDGYRMFGCLDEGHVRFISRNGQDWTARLGRLGSALEKLPARRAIVDGEVVVLDEHGVSNFQALQNALGDAGRETLLTYFVFDLLYLDGFDLRPVPLRERKRALKKLLGKRDGKNSPLQFSDHLVGSGAEVRQRACEAALEGIVSKRADGPYVPGRSTGWLKSKCRQGQELVIAGYTDPEGARTGFGALLVGYYDSAGHLKYAGRVGTGYDDETLRTLSRRMERLEQKRSPFAESPGGARARGVHWLKPELVGQFEFSNWTSEGLLRQGVFLGLREDKPARAVKREQPAARKTVRRIATRSDKRGEP